MGQSEVDKIRTVLRVSSSVANFHEKLKNYLKLDDWHWWRNRNDQVIFFGLYTWKDYVRFIWHRGPKKMFWCGSDILALSRYFAFFLIHSKGTHYCENIVEQDKLREFKIDAEIRPMLFDDPDKYQIEYQWSENPRIFGTYHKGREEEYGVFSHPQVDWLEGLSEEEFNEKIKSYQSCIRLNQFDGFSESLAKSVLMGQYPYSVIPYPYMNGFNPDTSMLKKLRKMNIPNYQGSNYWRKTLKENMYEVVENWTGVANP